VAVTLLAGPQSLQQNGKKEHEECVAIWYRKPENLTNRVKITKYVRADTHKFTATSMPWVNQWTLRA